MSKELLPMTLSSLHIVNKTNQGIPVTCIFYNGSVYELRNEGCDNCEIDVDGCNPFTCYALLQDLDAGSIYLSFSLKEINNGE